MNKLKFNRMLQCQSKGFRGREGTARPSTGNIRCGRHHVVRLPVGQSNERQRGPVRTSVLERIALICKRVGIGILPVVVLAALLGGADKRVLATQWRKRTFAVGKTGQPFWRCSNPSPNGSFIIGIDISERPSQMLFLKPDLNLH